MGVWMAVEPVGGRGGLRKGVPRLFGTGMVVMLGRGDPVVVALTAEWGISE
jgi:hypothetical protein